MGIEGTSKCHLVAVPYPGRGHINQMMNLCEIIASRMTDILITFVLTEEWLGFLGSHTQADNIRFGTIPNVIPSELGRAAIFLEFPDAVITKMEEPFEQLLDRLETPATTIIADSFLPWAVNVGNRRNIQVASLWPMSASVLAFFHHFQLLVKSNHYPMDLSAKRNEMIDYIPGLPPTRISDLPPMFSEDAQEMLHKALDQLSWLPKAQYLLISSIYELEAPVINSLKLEFSFPVYHIGPLIPHFNLRNISVTTTHSEINYLEWLDSQPENSVLYVSFGSFLSVSRAQMDEIIAGIRDSGIRCLWVARGDISGFKEGFGSMGVTVPWCDQLRVLCHPSVGGFLTHCGWNSTVEAVFGGVPMLTFPLVWDQIPNSKLIVEDWKIGWRVKKEEGVEKLVEKEEIVKIVHSFMDIESVEGKEMRRRARELGEICRRAIRTNGSSENNITAFIRDILTE